MTAGPHSPPPQDTHRSRDAWIATGFGIWLVGGIILVLWANGRGLAPDIAASPYHIPFYSGLLALTAYCGALVVRVMRRGHGWRGALPRGYGGLAVGAAALVAALILDVGWREGVGMASGLENGLAPSRILLLIGLALIASVPLRVALRPGDGRVPLFAVLISTALTIAVLTMPGGFHPATNPWLERPSDQQETSGELWVMDADGSHQTRLVEAVPPFNLNYASWSPDGSRIAYSEFHAPNRNPAEVVATVWTVAADGTQPTEVVGGDELSWIPRLSPDGRWLAYTREAPGGPFTQGGPVGPGAGPQGGGAVGPLTIPLPDADIWRVAADGSGASERLTDSTGDDRAPVYSPDGAHILFDSTRDGNTEIYVMDADGSNQRRLTNDLGEDWGASWSPDGRLVSFNSTRTGTYEIYVMEADGSGVRQLTSDGQTNVTPTWSPDGSRIAYSVRGPQEMGQTWSMRVDGGDRRNLSRSPSTVDNVWTGGWGPDGRIVFSRSLPPLADVSPLARNDLGAATMLLTAGALAVIVILLARTRPRLGAFTMALTLASVLTAIPSEAWRFIPVGVVTGLVVDVAAWRTSPARVSRVAGAVAGGAFVLASAATVLATSGLEWTPTLLLGVAAAAAAIGWGLGALGAVPSASESDG
jgi:Tol biopolymer transport system component